MKILQRLLFASLIALFAHGISHGQTVTTLTTGINQTVTAQHTFNPSAAGAPFILGANATGQVVTGLNADLLDGQDGAFYQNAGNLTGLVSTAIGGTNLDTSILTGIPSIASGTWSVTASLGLAPGGTGADLSATGGVNQFVKQSTAGGAFTVGTIADADVPDTITLGNLTQITTRAISDTTGTLLEPRGGTGEATYVLGDTLYSDAASSLARLTGNITTTKQFLSQTGTGTVSAAPTWAALADADIPDTITLTNVTQITNRAITDLTGNLPETRGGTNQTAYVLGDVLYSSAANTLAKLAGNITTGKQFLSQTGTGAVSAAPAWGVLVGTDIPLNATGPGLENTSGLSLLRSCADTQVLKWDTATTSWACQADITAGSPSWNSITNPLAAQALTMGANNTTWTFDNLGGVFKASFTSAFTTGSQMLIEQITGNPTGGTLLEAKAADPNVTAFKAGDGTNGITVSQAGVLAAIGTGKIQADLRLVGSNDTESTTAAGINVDMSVVSGLNIGVNTPFMIIASVRKTTGAAVASLVGLKLNATEVRAPTAWSFNTDAVESGLQVIIVGSHDASYLRSGMQLVAGSIAGFSGSVFVTADIPNAAITSITIRGNSGSSLVTMGVNFVKVYELVGS